MSASGQRAFTAPRALLLFLERSFEPPARRHQVEDWSAGGESQDSYCRMEQRVYIDLDGTSLVGKGWKKPGTWNGNGHFMRRCSLQIAALMLTMLTQADGWC